MSDRDPPGGDLDADTTRTLACVIGTSMFGLLGSMLFGALFDDEPHTLTAAELRRALDAAPPQTWHAYAIVGGWFNAELTLGPDSDIGPDEMREYFRALGDGDLRRWRRRRPTTPDALARHRLDPSTWESL